MPFAIGALELLAVTLFAVPALVLYARRDDRWRWLFAGSVCAILACVMTPADVFSTLLFLLAFLGVFTMGAAYRIPKTSTAE